MQHAHRAPAIERITAGPGFPQTRLTPCRTCLQIIAPLLRILEKMHTLKLMHRDIKPENIFLTGGGKFKLGDFGLALRFDEEIPFSRSGTLDYMAPEVLKCPLKTYPDENKQDSSLHYSSSVDTWAVGVLAYELLTGAGSTRLAGLRAALAGAWPQRACSACRQMARCQRTAADDTPLPYSPTCQRAAAS